MRSHPTYVRLPPARLTAAAAAAAAAACAYRRSLNFIKCH